MGRKISSLSDNDTGVRELPGGDELLRLSKLALDVSADSCMWADREGRILYANENACRDLGYTKDELLTMKVPDFDACYDEKRYSLGWDKVKRSGSLKLESVHVRKDGSRFPVLMTVNYVKLGEKEYAFNFIRDITVRKRVEESLKASQEMLQTIIDNIPQAVFWKDRNSVYTGCNQVFTAAAGLKTPEAIGGKTDYDLPWSEVADSFREWDRKVMENDRPEYHIIEQQLESSGRIAWVETNKIPLHDANGTVIGILGTYEDITERKRAEEATKEAKEQAELYVELMGHDINNFNHLATGYLEMALEALESEKRLRLEDKVLIERPIQALVNSSALIGNVRKLRRLMAEGVKTMPIDLDKVFRELESMSFFSLERDVSLNIQHVSGIMVEANELLKDVFVNLITNAVKHSDPEKPLTIDVEVEPVVENGKKYHRITVEDNGPGIPDKLKERLFYRFQRGATRAHGKGLGLYLVRTLVEGYHGKVWVEDRLSGDYTKGSRFVVELLDARR